MFKHTKGNKFLKLKWEINEISRQTYYLIVRDILQDMAAKFFALTNKVAK
jgi:hypothetical protein